jgi:hypothetical protein
MDKTLVTLMSIVIILLTVAILYFYMYKKAISLNPSYNFLQYLQGDNA